MKKVLKITAVTTLLSLGLAFSSYAGQWKQGTGANAGKWWYDEDNGTYATNGWRWIDGDGDRITALTRVAGCMCLRRHQIRRRWMPMVHEHRMEKLLR